MYSLRYQSNSRSGSCPLRSSAKQVWIMPPTSHRRRDQTRRCSGPPTTDSPRSRRRPRARTWRASVDCVFGDRGRTAASAVAAVAGRRRGGHATRNRTELATQHAIHDTVNIKLGICTDHPRRCSPQKFCMRSRVREVVIHVKLHENRLSLGSVEGRKSPSRIDLAHGLYNSVIHIKWDQTYVFANIQPSTKKVRK